MPGENKAWSIVRSLVHSRPARFIAQAAVLAVAVGGSVWYSQANKTITLSVDGQTTEVHSFASSVSDFLADEDISVGDRDLVAPAVDTSIGEGDTVVVRYARPLNLTVDGTERTFWTTELSVDKALLALGVRSDGAELSASRSSRIDRAGMTMSLSTPKSVTLVADGDKDKITTTAVTVSELLTDEKVKVGGLDKLSQVPSTPLRDGLTVKIARVTQKKVTKTSAIDHATKKTSTSKLYEGESKVVTQGKDGVQKAVWQITRTDGKITKRKLVDTKVTRKPVTEVVQVGTKEKPAASSSSSGGSSSGGSVGGGVDSLNWAALAECESGGNPKAVNPAGYYGLYQFSTSTWAAMGGSGNPADASSSEQTYRAKLLYQQSGAGQWPVCGKNL
ncbi:resuscitation-promoting factor [Kineosporia sp. NBRC 101731]|uniref:resuscitation-promoting factor n=1 Tax=Kineosporia sp. NBRC 101731 TaxID=3032199 RepID=UPI0024A3EB92|nr:resuscitation-promoting factor [Kineosporia sp. NBRC 101731]GLY28716.1 hypothetical protein Kisp02_20810 [Kineosporia sp. NBRC 101731]